MKFLEITGKKDSSETIIMLDKIDSISKVLGKNPFIRIMINGMPHTIDCGSEEETINAYNGIRDLIRKE